MNIRIPRYIIATRDSPVNVYSETGKISKDINSAHLFSTKKSAEIIISHLEDPEDYVLVEGLFDFDL